MRLFNYPYLHITVWKSFVRHVISIILFKSDVLTLVPAMIQSLVYLGLSSLFVVSFYHTLVDFSSRKLFTLTFVKIFVLTKTSSFCIAESGNNSLGSEGTSKCPLWTFSRPLSLSLGAGTMIGISTNMPMR